MRGDRVVRLDIIEDRDPKCEQLNIDPMDRCPFHVFSHDHARYGRTWRTEERLNDRQRVQNERVCDRKACATPRPPLRCG